MTETFKRSYETQALVDALSKMAVGDIAGYAALATAAGCPIDGSSAALARARAIVEKQRGFVFAALYKTGIKRLNDTEIVQASHSARTRINRAAKRSIRHLGSIGDYASLPPELQRTHTAHMTIMAVIAENASRATVKRIETATANSSAAGLLKHLASQV